MSGEPTVPIGLADWRGVLRWLEVLRARYQAQLNQYRHLQNKPGELQAQADRDAVKELSERLRASATLSVEPE